MENTVGTALLSKQCESQSLNSESFLKSEAATQKLDSTVSRVLNAGTQVWQNDYKDEFIYDSEMKNTSWLSKQWNLNTKTWDVWEKTELGYDNKKRVNSMLMYSRDSLNQALTKDSKILVFYNSEGMQDSTIWYSTKTAGTSWVWETSQIYHYNALKQLIKMDMWALDEETGVLTLSTNYLMDGEEMLWSKTENNHDGSGKLTSSEISALSFFTFVLEKSSLRTFQYNSSNDVSVEIYSTWSGTSWVDQSKDENTYSTTNFSDVIFPSFILLYGIDETGNSFFTVYPNPASKSVSFRWKGSYERLTLEMYQITGVKILEQTTNPGRAVSISGFENGIYFFKLLNGQQVVHTGKLIKK